MEWFTALTTWHWLSLGVVLLLLEVLGASGFLVGLAVASLTMAGAVALGLLEGWQYQLLIFAVLAVACTILYWRVFRKFNTASEEPLLNDRAAQLIGRKLKLQQNLENGQGRIQIGDTLWKAEAETELVAGTRVEVYASEGMTVKVRPI